MSLEVLLVGGIADGRRVTIPEYQPVLRIAALPKPCPAMSLELLTNSSLKKDWDLQFEDYEPRPFTGARDHRLYIYVTRHMTPRDTLERLVARYPEEVRPIQHDGRAWRAFTETLPYLRSGRAVCDLMAEFVYSYGTLPESVAKAMNEHLDSIEQRRRRG